MNATSEEWIQQSLTRLEALEEERQEHELALESSEDAETLRVHAQEIGRLEEEIADLYTALEAVASDRSSDDLDGDTEEFESPAKAQASAGDDAPSWASPAGSPLSSPPAASPFSSAPTVSPFSSAAASPLSSPTTSYSASADFDDLKPQRSPMAALLIGLLLVGGGAGGGYYYYMNQKTDAAPAEAASSGPAKVISSAPVPPDTQGPRAAAGAEVESSSGTEIRDTSRRRRGPLSAPSASSSSSSSRARRDDDKPKGTKIVNTDDPLGGI
ncbi:MAG: hypothetical protein R3A51_16855 [Nannocystaceae bacterium]